ncbi:MAG: sugar phosphate isomerase/epimerase [Planctomycetia bacterium]|nr:sugar phosphate isomerase/epimerase [Planctomycetia bacterium]
MTTVKLPRRDFLSAAAGLTAACAVPGTARADAGDLNLGIQLYSLRGYPVDEALRHAREIGFRFVEFYPGMYPLNSTPEQIAAMNKKLADLGLTISAHGVNGFGADAAANRKVFEFAKAAGIRILSADPTPEAFASLDELVKEFDIRIAIHNHGPKHRYNKVVDVLKAIEKHDSRIGACADLGHFIRSGENPVEVIRLLKGRLYGVHLKDFQDQQDKTKGVILGKGHLDVPAVFAALEQVQFPADGALSLEYEENPKDPLADIRECLEVAKSALAAV